MQRERPEKLRHRLPGWIATGFMVVATGMWTFWSFGELYHEAWGQSPPLAAAYLLPGLICVLLFQTAERWPRFGGVLIGVLGGLFSVWILRLQVMRGIELSLSFFLSWFPLTTILVVVGVLYFVEGRRRRRVSDREPPEGSFLRIPRRHLRHLLPVGTFLLVGLVVTAVNSLVFFRLDDGYRGARLIEGEGVRLVWAPEGPGWSRGGMAPEDNLSWNQIALYGMEPVGFGRKPDRGDRQATAEEMARFGLFRYLSADGARLMKEPQDVWRMPTKEEIVRSLVRNGDTAACRVPDELPGRVECRKRPDKETPLWAPEYSFIYMWADERDEENAWWVCYNGWVSYQPKSWGNPRHGHRFVRDPRPVEEADSPSLP